MCSKTVRCVIIFNYFAFYIFGAIILSLVTYFFVCGRPLYSFPNTDSKVKKSLKCLMVALGCYTLTLLTYSSEHMLHLLTFCIVGACFGGLFLAIVLMFRRNSALKKQKDDWKRMEEGSGKTSEFTSYTQEANDEKKI